MSISSALNNAVSGLSAVSRMADVVSSNTANALTDGYARREASLSSSSTGGVSVNGVSRQVSDALVKRTGSRMPQPETLRRRRRFTQALRS